MLVGQRGEHLDLALETGKIIGTPMMYDLHSYFAVQIFVGGQIDLCHAAPPNTTL